MQGFREAEKEQRNMNAFVTHLTGQKAHGKKLTNFKRAPENFQM